MAEPEPRHEGWQVQQTTWEDEAPSGINWRRLAIIAVASLVVAAIGVVAGRSIGHKDALPPQGIGRTDMVGGHLTLTGGSGWLKAKAPAWSRALLPGAIAAQPVANPAVTLLLTDLPDGGVAKLLGALRWDRGATALLSRGDLQARSYTGTFAAAPQLTGQVLLVPSSEGTSAATCLADPARTATPADDCAGALATLTLHGADPRPTEPGDEDRQQLGAIVSDLARARRRDVARLGDVATAGRQANVAKALAVSYDDAAKAGADVKVTQLAADSLVQLRTALTAGAKAYRALAAAADDESQPAFRRAHDSVVAADRDVRSALVALGSFGYTAV